MTYITCRAGEYLYCSCMIAWSGNINQSDSFTEFQCHIPGLTEY